MNILITGGCGFIGSNLIRYLESRPGTDDRIVVFDNLTTGHKSDLEGTVAELIEGDITDYDAVSNALSGIDHIVHLAAHTRVIESVENPRKNMQDNVIGTFTVLEAARDTGVESVVIASTGGAIIGEAEPPVHEEMVPKPISPYGASKLCCEAYCSAFSGAYGLRTTALRFANVYGPFSYHKGSVVAKFFRSIQQNEQLLVYGDGTQTRDFVFTKDLCRGITAALDRKGPAYDYFHLGSGKETSVLELLDLMEQVTGAKLDVRFEAARAGEIYRNYTKIGKAQRHLGFSPDTEFEAGLRETWEWFN